MHGAAEYPSNLIRRMNTGRNEAPTEAEKVIMISATITKTRRATGATGVSPCKRAERLDQEGRLSLEERMPRKVRIEFFRERRNAAVGISCHISRSHRPDHRGATGCTLIPGCP